MVAVDRDHWAKTAAGSRTAPSFPIQCRHAGCYFRRSAGKRRSCLKHDCSSSAKATTWPVNDFRAGATNACVEDLSRAGAAKAHGTLAAETVAAICGQLRGTRCGAWAADMKVHVESAGTYHCPDVGATGSKRYFAAGLLPALPVQPGARRVARPLTARRPEANRGGIPTPLDGLAQTAPHYSRPACRRDVCRAKEAMRCR
jgi:hypothetical protein